MNLLIPTWSDVTNKFKINMEQCKRCSWGAVSIYSIIDDFHKKVGKRVNFMFKGKMSDICIITNSDVYIYNYDSKYAKIVTERLPQGSISRSLYSIIGYSQRFEELSAQVYYYSRGLHKIAIASSKRYKGIL